jgi:hypothetical protein
LISYLVVCRKSEMIVSGEILWVGFVENRLEGGF